MSEPDSSLDLPNSNSTHWAELHWTILMSNEVPSLPVSLFPTPPITVMQALWKAQHTVKWVHKPHRQWKGQLATSVHGSSPICLQFFRESQTPSNSCKSTRYHSTASWEHFPFLWIHNRLLDFFNKLCFWGQGKDIQFNFSHWDRKVKNGKGFEVSHRQREQSV